MYVKAHARGRARVPVRHAVMAERRVGGRLGPVQHMNTLLLQTVRHVAAHTAVGGCVRCPPAIFLQM